MTTESFSRKTKNKLCEIEIKSSCCRRALFCGVLLFRQPLVNEEIIQLTERLKTEFIDADDTPISDIKDLFYCENCQRCFLRGVFLSCGMITDPSKLYQFELIMPDSGSADDITVILKNCGFTPKRTLRRGIHVIYLKDNEAVSDFLNLIGAQKASFELINVKIKKELRNNANRLTNCDAANITKTVSAAHSQVEAIKKLKHYGFLKKLPPGLYETAILRLENKDVALSELAKLHDPPITKSGVNHRLKKIINFLETMDNHCTD